MLSCKFRLTSEKIADRVGLTLSNNFTEKTGLKKVIENKGEDAAKYHSIMTQLYVSQAFPKVGQLAQEALAAIEKGDMLKANLSVLRKLIRWYTPVSLVELKTTLADKLIEEEKYWLV